MGGRIDRAHQLEAGRVVPLQSERARRRLLCFAVHELAVSAKNPHAELCKVLLRVQRGVGRRAVGPLPQPLLFDRCGPTRLDRVAQVRRQPEVHQAVGELVHEDVPPGVARVGVRREQVLLAARGAQPAWLW